MLVRPDGKLGLPRGFLKPGEAVMDAMRRNFAEQTLGFLAVSQGMIVATNDGSCICALAFCQTTGERLLRLVSESSASMVT